MVSSKSLILFPCLILISISCWDCSSDIQEKKYSISDWAEMKTAISDGIKEKIHFAETNNLKIDDSLTLSCLELVGSFYISNNFKPIWSDSMKWTPISDSLLNYLGKGLEVGLFPQDYKYKTLLSLHSFLKDSINRKNDSLWTIAELLYTDAFMLMARDLAQGRLQPDSLSWHHSIKKIKEFFVPILAKLCSTKNFRKVIDSLQPSLEPYLSLRGELKGFLDSMDRSEYTYINYPYNRNDSKDSIRFLIKLRKRLSESGIKTSSSVLPDSLAMASLIKQYQQKANLNPDGKIGASLVDFLNTSDLEKYKRLVVVLDRYKEFSHKNLKKYICVNLPEYTLRMWDKDSLVMISKIICGRTSSPTPLLFSNIDEIVMLPTWTVPASIIKKDMLPGLKRNSNYLARKGLYLLNDQGQRVSAASINWHQFSNGIPYRVQQGSGDNNALGLIKFNFSNPYSVYLHDTNQRSLFKNSKRALSHGCVRVDKWEELAKHILRYDSLSLKPSDTLAVLPDSVASFIANLKANKSRKKVALRNVFPLYICYFSCVSENGELHILEDVYKLDKILRDKYFASKSILPFL